MGKTVIQNKISIVESGTINNWTYRKWSDGTAECWVTHSHTFNVSVAWGSIYGSGNGTIALDYPSNFFINEPHVQITFRPDGLSSGFVSVDGPGSKNSTPSFSVVRGTSSTSVPGKAMIYAIGKWK